MRFRKFSGYTLYPLLAVLLLPSFLRAQDTSSQQPAAQQSQPPDQTTQDQTQSSQQQRAQVLKEAQARVNARRKIRIRQIIEDTYSHKYDLDFGGGALRFLPGAHLERLNEAAWHVDATDYIRGDLGITADFRGYYGTAFTGPNPYSVFNPSISEYSFLGGPTYRFFKGQHWGWTAQVLAGATHGNFGTGTNGLPPQLVGLFNDATVLSVAPGVAVDYNLSPALAFRIGATDLLTNFGSSFQENRGGTLGIVYRFGRK